MKPLPFPTVEICDLGDWGEADLRSEYDPQDNVIRINARVLKALQSHERETFVREAIAHETYHFLEHCGAIPVIRDRHARELAASSVSW